MFNESVTLKDAISEALKEAEILEMARDFPDKEHMLYIAQVLSGAPFSFVEQVHLSGR